MRENKSGIVPLSYKVLIKVNPIDEKTKGGIIIPTDTREKESVASQIATVIDKGPAAFTIGTGDLLNEWDIVPEIGAKILINRYAGIRLEGSDSEVYHIISDKEILAILKSE